MNKNLDFYNLIHKQIFTLPISSPLFFFTIFFVVDTFPDSFGNLSAESWHTNAASLISHLIIIGEAIVLLPNALFSFLMQQY